MSPWEVQLPAGEGLTETMRIQVPNPVRFVVQKFLIHERRPPNKKAQDFLYIHDTLELFAPQLPRLAEIWRDDVKPSLQGSGWIDPFMTMKNRLLAQPSEAMRDAAVIRRDRQLDPERMRGFCLAALDEIIQESPN